MRNIVKKMRYTLFVVMALAILLHAPVVSAAPILGDALASYAVLAATGVTSGGTGSTLDGNLGSYANPSLTGIYNFTSGSANPGTEAQAQLELDAAILTVNAFLPGATIADGNLDAFQITQGGVIAPGTYAVAASSTNLVGDLILDGGGSNTAMWIFQFSSTLITGSSSNVLVQNIGDGAGVGIYWTVADAATLNGPTFAGNVLANSLISSDGNLTIDCGRLLSANAQVTLIEDSISINNCLGGNYGYDQGGYIGGGDNGGGDNGGGNNGGVPVPEPATILLLGLGFVGITGVKRRIRK